MKPFRKNSSKRIRFVVKLTLDGKGKDITVISIMARTFLGPAPEGQVPYHKNGMQSENHINNIAYIDKKKLGKLTGAKAKRQPVAKIDSNGVIVEVYPSARTAAKKNFMCYQTITDRCNGKRKSAFAPDGYAYAWEDKAISMRNAIRKIELENGYMPKAPEVEFEW